MSIGRLILILLLSKVACGPPSLLDLHSETAESETPGQGLRNPYFERAASSNSVGTTG